VASPRLAGHVGVDFEEDFAADVTVGDAPVGLGGLL
jgi:hypothetical protein